MDFQLLLIRSGWSNPQARLPRATQERVAYRHRQGRLERLSYPNLSSPQATARSVLLLPEVTRFRLRFYRQGEWLTAWHAGGLLPQAVEITVETPALGKYGASSRCPRRGHDEKQRGMALLMVLLMMSLMAIVAVNINDHWQRSLARTQSQQDRLRAKWLLLGGEIYAQQRWRQAGEQRKAWGASGAAFSMRTEEGKWRYACAGSMPVST